MVYFRLLLTTFLVHILFFAHSQVSDSLKIRLQSPFATLEIFTTNLEGSNYQPEKATVIFANPNLSTEQKAEYAIKYEQLLEGAGTPIFLEQVPRDSSHFDSLTNEYRYVINPQFKNIFLERRNGLWQFQTPALAAIDAAHQEIFQMGTSMFLHKKYKGTIWDQFFLGLKFWQWVNLLVMILFCILIRVIFSLVFARLLIRFLDRLGYANIGRKYIVPVAIPTSNLLVVLFIFLYFSRLQLPTQVGYYVIIILRIAAPLFATIIFYRAVNIVDFYLLGRRATKSGSTLDHQLMPLLTKVLRTMIVMIGALVILDSFSIPILPLLTGLSIGGLAFALAAQDTIKNFFGSLMIFIDKPFQIGDWITTGEIDGTVEEVGFRSTRVRTFRNSVIYVPNGQLADRTIDNNGLRKLRRFRTLLALTYDTPPDLIEVFVEGLKRIVRKHPKTSDEKYEIHFNKMGATSLDVLFYIFIEAPTWSEELEIRQEILLQIMRMAKTLGVNFAFPTQTLHVENMPGQASRSPNYAFDKKELDEKLDQFINPNNSEDR